MKKERSVKFNRLFGNHALSIQVFAKDFCALKEIEEERPVCRWKEKTDRRHQDIQF